MTHDQRKRGRAIAAGAAERARAQESTGTPHIPLTVNFDPRPVISAIKIKGKGFQHFLTTLVLFL